MSNTNTAESIFSLLSNYTTPLSLKTISNKLSLHKRHVHYTLKNDDRFTRAQPLEVGSHKWFNEKHFTTNPDIKENSIRNIINLWKLA